LGDSKKEKVKYFENPKRDCCFIIEQMEFKVSEKFIEK